MYTNNISFGIFAAKLQLAKVIPLFKKGCPLSVSNYRPISLFSIFSKIFEKLMHTHLYNFLECYKILILTSLDSAIFTLYIKVFMALL